MGDEADQRLGVRGRRHDDVEPLGLEREVVHGGLDGELLHLHAVVPRRFARERGDPRSIAADGRDACAAGARDVERAGERPFERRVEERAEERDGAAPVERDAVHARPEIELRLDPGEGGIRGCGDEDRLRAERRAAVWPSAARAPTA